MTHQDIPVLVGINSKGVYVIDDINCVGFCLQESLLISKIDNASRFKIRGIELGIC